MKESEKEYQIKTFFVNGEQLEKIVCVNNDEQLKKDILEIINRYSEWHLEELPERKICNNDPISMTLEYKPNVFKYYDGEKWIEIQLNNKNTV